MKYLFKVYAQYVCCYPVLQINGTFFINFHIHMKFMTPAFHNIFCRK